MAKKSILNYTLTKSILKYKKTLIDHGIKIDKVILFGSYATGKQKPWSDIDLCIVSRKFGSNEYEEMVNLNQLTYGINAMIEAHPYHPKDLEDPFDPLAYEIRKYGKVVD